MNTIGSAGERASILSLLLIAGGCALLVWTVNALTAEPISDARNAALRDALGNLAGAQRVSEIAEPLRFPLVLCEQRTVLHSASRGYGGMIELLIAVGPANGGTVLALQTQRHAETPGIGDFIATRETPWLDRFIGSHQASLAARPASVDAVSGATITVRGVRRALSAALDSAPPFTDRRCGSKP